jgi:hypothetical protein
VAGGPSTQAERAYAHKKIEDNKAPTPYGGSSAPAMAVR